MPRLLRRLFLLIAGRRQPKGGRHRATPEPPTTAPPTVDDAWAAITAANPELDQILQATYDLYGRDPRR